MADIRNFYAFDSTSISADLNWTTIQQRGELNDNSTNLNAGVRIDEEVFRVQSDNGWLGAALHANVGIIGDNTVSNYISTTTTNPSTRITFGTDVGPSFSFGQVNFNPYLGYRRGQYLDSPVANTIGDFDSSTKISAEDYFILGARFGADFGHVGLVAGIEHGFGDTSLNFYDANDTKITGQYYSVNTQMTSITLGARFTISNPNKTAKTAESVPELQKNPTFLKLTSKEKNSIWITHLQPTHYQAPPEYASLYVDGVSAGDIIQGNVGDCSFLAVLSSIAETNPNFIQNDLIEDNHDGTYTIKFQKGFYSVMGKPKPFYVTVNNTIPVNKYDFPVYAHSLHLNEFWVSIIEKAYAQFKGGTYRAIDGLAIEEAYFNLTGKRSIKVLDHRHLSENEIDRQLKDAIDNGRHIFASSNQNAPGQGIADDHAYAMLGIEEDRNGVKRVILRNPWGQSTNHTLNDRKDTGILKLTFAKYLYYFGYTSIF
jgi:hypothetical protein